VFSGSHQDIKQSSLRDTVGCNSHEDYEGLLIRLPATGLILVNTLSLLTMFPQVLATVGGSGTRLYPLTLDLPKPLVEICDTAIIDSLFRVLAVQGSRKFILGSKGANNTLNLSNYFKAG
jgi:hypothetical protein